MTVEAKIDLIIGGIVVPIETIWQFTQTYDAEAAEFFERAQDGTGYARGLGWRKLSTTISGQGWLPAPIAGIAVNSTQVIQCAAPYTVSDVVNFDETIPLPYNHRTDAKGLARGYGVVGGLLVETAVLSVVASLATLQTVAGATGYVCQFYPEITATVTDVRISGGTEGVFDFSITAREQ